MGQLSHCPVQFSRPLHYLDFEFVARFAELFLSSASFMNQVGAAECRRSVVRSYCEQHPVSWGGELATLTGDGYEPSIRAEANRNNKTTERLRSVIKTNDIWHDRLTQRLLASRKLGLQPA